MGGRRERGNGQVELSATFAEVGCCFGEDGWGGHFGVSGMLSDGSLWSIMRGVEFVISAKLRE